MYQLYKTREKKNYGKKLFFFSFYTIDTFVVKLSLF